MPSGGDHGGRFAGSDFLAESAALRWAREGGRQEAPAMPGGPTELADHNAVGADLLSVGRPTEAAAVFRRVLAECARVLGPEHPDTLVVTGNFATALAYAGRLVEAMRLLEVNLASRIAVFGDGHPRTLDVRDALGTVLRLVGRPADAAVVHSLVARQRELALGAGHPDTLVSRLGLALDRADAGDLGPASDALEDLLDDAVAASGPDDPVTTAVRSAAAAVAFALGRVEYAVVHLQVACAAAEVLYGPAHPDVAALRAELAEAVAAQAQGPARPRPDVTSPAAPSATRAAPGRRRRRGAGR